ncbi:MAG: hypothetical protein COB36_09080 [Alphaproteobacteria bacterium]|nr:MAG: hypothetical protein COB36_09080 [Alphaproteobacteria bacterium]
MSKILITAFEPFGLIGAWFRSENTSQQLINQIQQTHGEEFLYQTLPTSEEAIPQFLAFLDREKPTGILSMGEHLLLPPQNIKLEPFAYDISISTLPLKQLFAKTITSDFVSNIDEQHKSSSIGSYYCNQIYLQGMNWAKENGNIPVAFTHIPVLGNHDEHAQQVADILQKMQHPVQDAPDLNT